MPMTPEHKRIANMALADAVNKKTAAGYNGEHHDGGAGRIKELVQVWIDGLEGRIPEALREYQEQAQRESDPEWAEYQRLHQKFRGR